MATVGDWERQFAAELAEAPWDEVVRAWVPRLAPGLMAAATHGWLRTAHAVRRLRVARDPRAACRAGPRTGLLGGPLPGRSRPDDAVGDVGRRRGIAALPDRRTGGDGLIFESVRASLDGDAEFVAAVDAVDGRRSTSTRLLAAAGGEIVAGGAGDPIVYVHTLTPTAAIRRVADLVDAADVDLVLGCAWRAVAALVSTYRLPPCRPGSTWATSTPTRSSTEPCGRRRARHQGRRGRVRTRRCRRSDGAGRRRRARRSTQWLIRRPRRTPTHRDGTSPRRR